MKVEHAFLPRGELVLMITVQSEEDRKELLEALRWDCINPKRVELIIDALCTAKEFFKQEEK